MPPGPQTPQASQPVPAVPPDSRTDAEPAGARPFLPGMPFGDAPDVNSIPPDAHNTTPGASVGVAPSVDSNLPVILTPQMLLPFFKPFLVGTNGVTGTLALPIEFVPPTPVPLPSNRATYNVR